MPKPSRRASNGTSPTPGSMRIFTSFSGVVAATSSMSIPPAALAIINGLPAARSSTRLRYTSRAMWTPVSTRTRRTSRPALPVCRVTRVMPII